MKINIWYHIALVTAILSWVQLSDCNGLHEKRRSRREVSSIITELARQFFNSGGQQGVNDLAQAEDKSSILKRVLGSAVAGYMFGNSDNIVNQIMNMYRGNSGQGSRTSSGSSGGYVPSSGTSSRTGVSIVESNPNSYRPSSSSYDRGTSGRGTSGGYRDNNYNANNNANIQQQSPGSSKTGVTLIDSQPGDQRPSRPVDRDGLSNNNGERGRWGEFSSNSRGTQTGSGRFGDTTDSSETRSGSRGGSRDSGRRVAPEETDY